MARADREHQRAQLRLAHATRAAVYALLAAITLDRTPLVRQAYALQNSRIIAGGQHQSVMFAFAYMAALAAPTTPPLVDRALEGRLTTPETPSAIVGLLRLWNLLDHGTPEAEARAQAGSYAGGLASGDLLSAQRGGLDEGARASGRRVRWRKQLSADPCEWCAMIASGGARYHSADSVPFHQRDRCTVAPEFV